ncbi:MULTISPECIES: VOC family protein [Citrobacter]|uniref:VOC family protein n=1 Tax=Citrobacter TaxID=544 RepID=UPI0011DDA8A2|nr:MULTISPECIES: VOC family protein [Citrobacter]EGT0022910.1 glyoxalase/bleomycin resistance/extradiol dioxygenase family protein [Citrobacter freundii]EGT0458613.1 glyoxalase/bleomycin resistance/extradiol dioxygenase family protein [Citrobacter freundii]EGT0459450.1 glyoxalase/bleomycin resistance/extradiol dioxygenase family protein [Citrobacter freundii]MBA8329331.1 VOC family protein [Citrobacter freundii]MBA8333437.1 VOC family protein [Citrobacter freundii]
MKIAHMALWTQDLEQQAHFWVSFFDGKINEKYFSRTNPGFESYFVKIGEDIAIELMTKPGLVGQQPDNNRCGWVHLAISVGSSENVDAMAKRAKEQGILVSGPRTTGDGYYEAVIHDPDGNLIEIVA